MPVRNHEIADMFDKVADLLEVEGANPFRIRAYREAARTVRGHPENMADLLRQGKDLSEISTIGKDLAEKIQCIVSTGSLPLLKEIEKRTPATLSDLLRIEGLGPKRVAALYTQLGIRTLDDLRRAARSGKIRSLEGFGKKTEQKIRERVDVFEVSATRTKLKVAEEIANSLIEYLSRCRGVKKVIVAGSFRRRRESVGDLDILVTAKKDSAVMDYFTEYDEVVEVLSKGTTRGTVRLRSGLSVDLRVVPQVSYGAALIYFTGSKAHNIALRKRGIRKGYKINEYGVFKDHERVAGKTEQSVYKALDLPFFPPEIRENRGEFEAARKRCLPKLIALDDIRGDLHCHTRDTDGHHTLKQMALAAAEKGYEYLSVNDHSRRLTVANGLDEKRLLQQIRAIDRLNETLSNIVILKSIEVDILEDGTLDLPDSVLSQLDFTVGAIHYKFDLSQKKQTERLLRAMDSPYFTILAHPTGRLINQRTAYSIDIEKVMVAAKERGCFLELNAHPDRLDLDDVGCRLAKDIGLKVSIATDSHRTLDLDFMRFGVDQARRGWLEPADVINTLPARRLRSLFRRS